MDATNVRVLESTKKLIDNYAENVNKKRKKAGMFRLTKMQVIDIAIKKLEESDGMKS